MGDSVNGEKNVAYRLDPHQGRWLGERGLCIGTDDENRRGVYTFQQFRPGAAMLCIHLFSQYTLSALVLHCVTIVFYPPSFL
jgi:hypothetical protein